MKSLIFDLKTAPMNNSSLFHMIFNFYEIKLKTACTLTICLNKIKKLYNYFNQFFLRKNDDVLSGQRGIFDGVCDCSESGSCV